MFEIFCLHIGIYCGILLVLGGYLNSMLNSFGGLSEPYIVSIVSILNIERSDECISI